MPLSSNISVMPVPKIMSRHSTLHFSIALVTILALALLCFGQNNNSSSTKSGTKRKKQSSTKIPKLDLSALSVFDWVQVGTTNDSVVSFNVTTVKRLTRNVVRAWTKTKLKDDTQQTKSNFLRNRRAQSLTTVGYDNYSHTLELDEYNCATGQGRVLSHVDYDSNGNVLDSTTVRSPEWTYVVPDSIGDSMLRALCKRK
jgi:hypothetical protein